MDSDEISSQDAIERFRAELRKPLAERYFDESELIYIIDSASDNYDDYIRSEALLMGARLFPDSIPLLERRAVLYLDTDRNMFVSFMDDYSDLSSPLFDILRLNLLINRPHDEIVLKVEEFIKNFKFNQDEEVIQFIQTLHSLGLDQWLLDNINILKEKTSYLPSLLYEFAVIANEGENIFANNVSPFLEELTEIEPYVADYWTQLAIAYEREGKTHDAFGALEYALAIEPDNIAALRVKLGLLFSQSRTDEMGKVARQLHEMLPDEPEFAGALIISEPGSSIDFVNSLSPRAKASPTIILRSIFDENPELPQILENAYDYGVSDPIQWMAFAEFANKNSFIQAIPIILKTFEKKSGAPLRHDFLMLLLAFQADDYELVSKIFATGADPESPLRSIDYVYYAYSIYIISLLRSGQYSTAQGIVKSILNNIDYDSRLDDYVFQKLGIKAHLNDILTHIDSFQPADWENYKPLIPPRFNPDSPES